MDAEVFTWEEMLQDQPMPLIDRRRITGKQIMLAQVFLHKGFDLETHSHENEQFACVLSGRVRFGLGEPGTPERREVIVSSGQVLTLPSNVPHSAFALEDSLLIDVFSPPSEGTGVDAHGRD